MNNEIIPKDEDQDHPLSQEEFSYIYTKVPRLTVEIIVKNDKGAIYLTKRDIEPYKGFWHLPGGTVRFGELMTDAVKRVAKRELGIVVNDLRNVGYIEYPSHFENGIGSPVGIVFEVGTYNGEITVNNEAEEGDWFKKLPNVIHPDQDKYLLVNGYLQEE